MAPVCLDAPICLNTPCMFGWCLDAPIHTQHKYSMLCHIKGVSICTHTFGCPLYVWMLPYVWIPPVCLDAPHMFGHTPCMFGCPLHVCTPPIWLDAPSMFGSPLYVLIMFGCPLHIHNTKKECFVTLRDVHMPHTFWCPICLDGPLYDCMPHMFGWTPVCLNNLICLDTPVCLDNVWIPPYIHNTKIACFFTLRECPYAPIHLDAPICLDTPCMFGCTTYVWTPSCMFGHHPYVCMPPVCLETPYMFGNPLYIWMMFGCPLYIHNTKRVLCYTKGCPYAPYTWMPHMFGCPHVWMVPCMFECPHMFGCPNMCGHTHMFGCPPYVWTPCCMFEWYLDAPCTYTTHRIMLCHTKGVSIYPHTFGCPHTCGCTLYVWKHPLYVWTPQHVWMAPCLFECCHMFGHPLYVLMSPCLDTTHTFGCTHMFGCPPCLDAPHVWTPCSMFGWCLDAPRTHNT